ncbi:type IV toxin-antitoxin system AbiEi family antitoxin domain-containing protein [Enterococcus canis]|uniref:type IV toxin-antitoxin system AbiEi family antitoxin domain-containing protein n=1 Tax=Enterococcus canis TaxID=214095 RepID=UPI000832B9B5|nr:type IV toxin-antitoxin system AbiEi family antitoxin domain-containing protein [Enterococcus canis]
MRLDIQKLFEQYNGTVSQKIARKKGIHPTTLFRLVERGEVCQKMPGIYTLPDTIFDVYFALQQKYTRSIFSHKTALFLQGMIDLNVDGYDLTFPNGSTRKVADGLNVVVHFTPIKNYLDEVTVIQSPMGNNINVFSKERTLCEIWSPRLKCDSFVKNQALKKYMNSPNRNLEKLMKNVNHFSVPDDLVSKIEIMI